MQRHQEGLIYRRKTYQIAGERRIDGTLVVKWRSGVGLGRRYTASGAVGLMLPAGAMKPIKLASSDAGTMKTIDRFTAA